MLTINAAVGQRTLQLGSRVGRDAGGIEVKELQVGESRELREARAGNMGVREGELFQSGEAREVGEAGIVDWGVVEVKILKTIKRRELGETGRSDSRAVLEDQVIQARKGPQVFEVLVNDLTIFRFQGIEVHADDMGTGVVTQEDSPEAGAHRRVLVVEEVASRSFDSRDRILLAADLGLLVGDEAAGAKAEHCHQNEQRPQAELEETTVMGRHGWFSKQLSSLARGVFEEKGDPTVFGTVNTVTQAEGKLT
jgi:hypothetical protein